MSMAGKTHTEAAKAKISAGNRGRRRTAEQRRKISQGKLKTQVLSIAGLPTAKMRKIDAIRLMAVSNLAELIRYVTSNEIKFDELEKIADVARELRCHQGRFNFEPIDLSRKETENE